MSDEMAPAPAAGAAATEAPSASGEELPELLLFAAKEAYVYRVPPATTAGHRAELWDVNKWMAAVELRVVQTENDEVFIRLLDEQSGDLFAECPVPTDKPLGTAVEPVVDSSRYFVLRIVDRASQRHAFVGVGFRERNEASDFNAALYEFLQYIKRKRTAEAMRAAYEERAQSAAPACSSGDGGGAAAPQADYSIKEGETLKLSISAPKRAGTGGFVSKRGQMLAKQFSLILDGRGGAVAALSPPTRKPSGPDLPDMGISPGGSPLARQDSSGSSGGGSPLAAGRLAPLPLPRLSGAGEGSAELQQRLAALRLLHASSGGEGLQQAQYPGGEGPPSSSVSAASGSPAAVTAAAAEGSDDDDFGDFVST
ncbi:Adaptin ear-binding coat-associated 2 [Micractinium conductrix]|uniref:Adaptin ear-binding coat-associated 2 n=1 Tax=Micractinium conductrix TaxID=554055 RepID=A0A2P6V458_9CHLO|nr:Adaptin ear-binding coat-associated 2 [Micractinium conductrix]|eukprot:PSC68868.1 Adaptin ear-binding coat-associated 2 [Micractinium conductrix]